ncbi:MAG: Hint domain-containing protein, partial [Nitrososphaerota archaeon]
SIDLIHVTTSSFTSYRSVYYPSITPYSPTSTVTENELFCIVVKITYPSIPYNNNQGTITIDIIDSNNITTDNDSYNNLPVPGSGGSTFYYVSKRFSIQNLGSYNIKVRVFVSESDEATGDNNGIDLNFKMQFNVVCYLKGTHILTPNGEVPIEKLSVGDYVCTYKNGKIVNKKIKWIVTLTPFFRNKHSYPIKICKSAFVDIIPHRNLYVSPAHRIYLFDTLIPAIKLVNGKTIYQDRSIKNIKYYHIELDEHSILIAEGLFAESYEDCGNRSSFDEFNKCILHVINKIEDDSKFISLTSEIPV